MITLTKPSVKSTAEKRLFGLDLMRACSIIMVFLSHSTLINPLNKQIPYFALFGVGVEAFFVLSGFLIGKILLKTLFKPDINWTGIRIFWINRWLRTYPAYVFTLVIYYFVQDARHIFTYVFFVQNLITPISGFFTHSWSLAVEEWFYFTFPIGLLVVSFLIKEEKAKLKIFFICCLVFIVFGLVTKITYFIFYKNDIFSYLIQNKIIFPSWKIFTPPYGKWDDMRKIVPFRIDAISYGCVIAYMHERSSRISNTKSIWMLIIGIISLLLSFHFAVKIVGGGGSNFFADVFLLPLFCFSFAMFIPSAVNCPSPGKFTVKIVTSLSQTSYSFYLIHFLVLEWMVAQFPRILDASPLDKFPVFIGTYLLTYILAYLMFKFIETPFLNLRKKLNLSMGKT